MKKNRFGSILLSLKLTGQFIIFGLIISYFSLILGAFSEGKEIFEGITEFLERTNYNEENQDDWIHDIFVTNPLEGDLFFQRLMDIIPPDERENFSFAIFLKPDRSDWQMLAAQGWLRLPPGDSQAYEVLWEDRLDEALVEKIIDHKGVYIGQAERQVVFLNITPQSSVNSYVAAMEFNQIGLFELLYTDKETFSVYTVLIVFFSLILGLFFSHRLARSIRLLTDNALRVANGEEAVRFSIRRLDDVGILSRAMDRMTYHLNHMTRTMETMNQIDRAVLSSVSRQDLLTDVASFIADQFKGASVSVLEKGSLDYHVLALLDGESSTAGVLAEYTILAQRAEDLPTLKYPGPEEILAEPPAEPFEFKGVSRNSLYRLFGKDGVYQVALGFPLILDENVVGIIIITKNSFTNADREALRMLADQVGVALKSLTEYKVKERLHQGLLLSLTRSIDAKSRWTGGHSERVTKLAVELADHINTDKGFRHFLELGGLLHDIGKMAIPEVILNKPGKLTDEEFDIIRSHPVRGYEIVKDLPNFDEARKAIRSHHERWDGTGYPDGLKGEEIPFVSRIITICDVYDAVTEDRPYRKGFPLDEARLFMLKERGKLFDPDLLDQFLEILDS